jgi:hypothetical protein
MPVGTAEFAVELRDVTTGSAIGAGAKVLTVTGVGATVLAVAGAATGFGRVIRAGAGATGFGLAVDAAETSVTDTFDFGAAGAEGVLAFAGGAPEAFICAVDCGANCNAG